MHPTARQGKKACKNGWGEKPVLGNRCQPMEKGVGKSDDAVKIPDKVYFKIGEVCRLTGIKTHTLRYWESEFSAIKPKRAGSGQRLYQRGDIETILQIKRLIQEEGLTIAGARKHLARQSAPGKIKLEPPKGESRALLHKIKADLKELQDLLNRK